MYDAGLEAKSLNVLASPLQTVRDTFDLMPTDTDERWRVLAARLAKVPTALAQYAESLRFAKSSGRVSPQRQVAACVPSASGSSHRTLLLRRPGGLPRTEPLGRDRRRRTLQDGRGVAASAYATLGEVLRDELLRLPRVGRLRHRHLPAQLAVLPLGAVVDLGDLPLGPGGAGADQRRHGRGRRTIRPGATVQEAIEIPSTPTRHTGWRAPTRCGVDAGARRRAIASLADTHFDIPDPIRTIECRIAPTQTGGIYYTGPSDDFSRPGRMWWSVPRA